jgi:hypothetical protein
MPRGEYEPRDSRKATGEAGDPKKSWREQQPQSALQRSEYEPADSRNVTGDAETPDGRWTGKGRKPPPAAERVVPPKGEGDDRQ